MIRTLRAAIAATVLAAALALAPAASAADSPGLGGAGPGYAGNYDFLVYVLSWSPSYCESLGEAAAETDPQQCGRFGKSRAFIVHGLWPQYERGWPEYCLTPAPKLEKPLVERMLDIMPSRRLIAHQWAKHGTCSGLDAAGYFELVRQVRTLIRIPPDLQEMYAKATVSPMVVERMFREVNSGLEADEIAVTCERRRLREVRICLDRDLDFRPCPEVERRSCKADWIIMPPARPPTWP